MIFVIEKVKTTVSWTYVTEDLNSEEMVGTFYEKELQKTNQAEFTNEEVINKKVVTYILSGKVMIILLIAGNIKKT